MIKKFIKFIKKNQPILLSYSGGLDSTVLLYQLNKFTHINPFIKLRAIHINHQINKNSEFWTEHCKKTCKILNIQFITKKINIKKKNNIQETARKIRYKTIVKYMLPKEILVTGHHLDDQCETLFLSLKRGSGLQGLSGISYIKNFKKKKIIRPLLFYSKNEIQKWAKKKKIKWIEDDSNKENKYDRNFIRNKIIKNIKKKWPYFINNCFKSMKICENQIKSLNQFLDKKLSKYLLFKDILRINIFKDISKNTKILLLKRWIEKNKNIMISHKQTKEIYKIISDEKKKIQLKNIIIQKYKNKIFQIPIYPSIKNTILLWHNLNQVLKLPQKIGKIIQDKNGIKIIKPNKNEIINIRFQTKKNITINKKIKKIKNIWQENNVPPWMRNKIPCLFYNDTLIAILGILVIKNYNTKKKKNKFWKIAWIG